VALVRQVVCLDDELIALAGELGHDVYAASPNVRGYNPGRAGLVVGFPLLLDARLVASYRGALWGLHPGLLPWGRGLHPVFWALWEGAPAGATLHELTVACNAGPVVEQKGVAALPWDTGEQLAERVERVARELFLRWLPRLAAGERPPASPQPPGGSHHTLAEFEFLRDEGRYEVPRSDRQRLSVCLSAADRDNVTAVPQTRWRNPS
jgi:methionyl-tRNA formyltransferase